MIFPFKVVSDKGQTGYAGELAVVLGAELAKEGDIELVSGEPYLNVLQGPKPDPERVARLAQRLDLFAVLWGTLNKLESGYSLDLWAIGKDSRMKPRTFSASGKDMEELLSRMQETSVEVGRTVLDRPVVGAIKIEGNKRIQKDAILNKLGMKQGSPFRRSAVADEIREVYSMGYFEDVQIKAEPTSKGQVDLHVVLKERPSIKEIEINGAKLFTKDEILDALTTKSFSVVSLEKIRDDIAKIKKMYEKKGYYSPEIDYEVKEISRNEAKLILKVKEGTKSYLTDIILDGAKKLSPKELKAIMTIKEKTWFWFLDDSGTFTRANLEENRQRLIAYYLNKGFIGIQVGAPTLDMSDGKVKVTYPIREGERYQVRKVSVTGDMLVPEDKILPLLKTQPRKWFDRESVADDIKTLTKLYNNGGYAYADVEPSQTINEEHRFLDLNFKITQGQKVAIERVDIKGNERTRGKVIRRSLAIGEGDLYNADLLDMSKKNLEVTDFFEAVKIKTSPGSKPDLMGLEVEVLEKKTGSLAAGLGYSSQDGAMGNVNLKERNLFGMGIVANVKANLSGRKNSYEGSITYPWILDVPLSGTLNAYRHQQKEDRYFRESDGFGIHFGYPVYGAWSLSGGFSRDSSKLSSFERVFAASVVNYYGKYGFNANRYTNIAENAISVALTRDTRYGSPLPQGGSKVQFGSRFSGLGGDVAFSRHYSEAIYYQPLVWRATMKFRASATALAEAAGSPIPFDRRVLLGGISSIRGYQYGQIGPRDRFGNVIGGDRSLFGTVECLFPLIESLKLNGVAFFDAGNAWNNADSLFMTEVKAGGGVGVRWISPMGPIRIEYGWKLKPLKGETAGAVAFAMGDLF
jgi:outer membrane protein insertion porin family